MAQRAVMAIEWLDRHVGRAANLFAIAGGIAVALLMMTTVVAVGWRYGLNDPILGIEDISVITLTIVAAAAVAYGARHNAHVSVDVISKVFGRKVTRITDAVMRALVTAIAALAAYALFTKACGIEKACVTGNLSIVHRPYYYVLGVALAIYAVHVFLQLLIGLANFMGDDPNEAGG